MTVLFLIDYNFLASLLPTMVFWSSLNNLTFDAYVDYVLMVTICVIYLIVATKMIGSLNKAIIFPTIIVGLWAFG